MRHITKIQGNQQNITNLLFSIINGEYEVDLFQLGAMNIFIAYAIMDMQNFNKHEIKILFVNLDNLQPWKFQR